MTVTSEEFKQGMRRLGGAVNIITTSHEGVFAGLTATAVTSLSSEPPKLLACINRAGVTYETISKGRCLGVNVLGVQHRDMAMLFAGMDGTPETDRFASAKWTTGKGGAPLLQGSLVSFDCEVDSILDAGSHAIVIGAIKAVHLPAGAEISPLCYLGGNWMTMTSFAE
ncbi:MAG: flavin reductase family protein [Kordiimonadaceae bacterium]|nr:flavin reductase family protein [Kordiimonadaceae bacterium]